MHTEITGTYDTHWEVGKIVDTIMLKDGEEHNIKARVLRVSSEEEWRRVNDNYSGPLPSIQTWNGIRIPSFFEIQIMD